MACNDMSGKLPKVAFIGIRGVPVIYSGFEKFVEEFGERWIKRGGEVIVYCRENWIKGRKYYKGIERVFSKTCLKGRGWESLGHSLLASLHVLKRNDVEVVYYTGVGAGFWGFLVRFLSKKLVVVNVDGLDWKRKKWGVLGKLFLLVSEYLSVVWAHVVVTDSYYVKRYYERRYGVDSVFIAYGGGGRSKEAGLDRLGLKKKRYVVWGGRLVPDNHLEELISAWKNEWGELVVLGETREEKGYLEYVRRMARGKKVLFLGSVEHGEFLGILKNSKVYVETKRSGGTHPSLLDAMSMGCLILANDHLATKEVLGEAGAYYKAGDSKSLGRRLQKLLNFDRGEEIAMREKAKKRSKKYTWEMVMSQYQRVLDIKK